MKKKAFYHKLFQKYLVGVAVALGLASGALLSVAVTGVVNSFSDGEILSAGKLNTNFASLKTAIESIPNWTKSGNDALLSDGGVTVLGNVTSANGGLSVVNNITSSAGGVTVANDITSSNGRVRDKTGFVLPVGTINAYGGTTAPAGWLNCDGASVSQATYPDLYAVIGCNFGCSGTNFNLPDLRGRFLRGRDGGIAARDPDRGARTVMNAGGQSGDNVGSVQGDANRAHNHGFMPNNGFTSGGSCWWDGNGGAADCSAAPTNYIMMAGGNESRPVNAYVNWIVKY